MHLMYYVKTLTEMNDNTDRLLEAIEHPDRFSDEELAVLLSDPDTLELYNLLRKTSEAVAQPPLYNLDEEWDHFMRTNNLEEKTTDNNRKERFLKIFPDLFNSHAAAVIALAIVTSLAVVAATVGIKYALERHDTPKQEIVDSANPEIIRTAKVTTEDSITPQEAVKVFEIVTFKDEIFENVINVICEYYGVKADFNNQPTKDLHLYYKWDQSLPLTEVVDELNNFDRINLRLNDNTITID